MPFKHVVIIGFGLIGSSIARALRQRDALARIVCVDASRAVCDTVLELGLADDAGCDCAAGVAGADLVVVCVPMGAIESVVKEIAPHLAAGVVVSDVGSVKGLTARIFAAHLPAHVHGIPGHPIAGTEHSGPRAGFAELFRGRWCILTPGAGADPAAVARLADFWRGMGSQIVEMDPDHHDRTLAITSHLPHLIAYTIVDTATQLESDLQSEVIKFSASGFRDFTRIAASDPVMWRDVFLNNRDAVLDILARFNEDLTQMQKAIRKGDGAALEAVFTRTRAVRRAIIDAKQDMPEELKRV
ncbi:MAG: prephenate/arogenate dehydrogenase family protein [Rhodospirillales bacterium]|nr:prephenate/arogenate dehydrogenase family protein [Alphaproteobacteria bacterium]MCB9987248.1 prephenate/arogenate dehydrogenase family protein [Rhodospirillales bacterium]USO07891.1 MAG: prephenate/arogenate dehydrogenase family protein [Rhodospirillales bacterium]